MSLCDVEVAEGAVLGMVDKSTVFDVQRTVDLVTPLRRAQSSCAEELRAKLAESSRSQ